MTVELPVRFSVILLPSVRAAGSGFPSKPGGLDAFAYLSPKVECGPFAIGKRFCGAVPLSYDRVRKSLFK